MAENFVKLELIYYSAGAIMGQQSPSACCGGRCARTEAPLCTAHRWEVQSLLSLFQRSVASVLLFLLSLQSFQ